MELSEILGILGIIYIFGKMISNHLEEKQIYKDEKDLRNYINKHYKKIDETHFSFNKAPDKRLEKIEDIYWSKISKSQKDILKKEWMVVIGDTVPSGMIKIIRNGKHLDEYLISQRGYTISCAQKVIFIDNNRKGKKFQTAYIFAFADAIYCDETLSRWKEMHLKHYKSLMEKDYDKYKMSGTMDYLFRSFAYFYMEYFLNGDELRKRFPDVYKFMKEINNQQ